MKYAIFNDRGKQYQVSEGDELLLPRLATAPKKKITFDQVLLVVDGKKISLGTPTLSGAKVTAEVTQHLRGQKIRVSTFKAKSRYRKTKGYRDNLTRVKIVRILNREKKVLTKSKSK